MDAKLQDYLERNCHQHGRVKVCELIRGFHKSLSPRDAGRYPRWFIVRELQSKYAIGVDSDDVHWVTGLSLEPAKDWQVGESGRLVKA